MIYWLSHVLIWAHKQMFFACIVHKIAYWKWNFSKPITNFIVEHNYFCSFHNWVITVQVERAKTYGTVLSNSINWKIKLLFHMPWKPLFPFEFSHCIHRLPQGNISNAFLKHLLLLYKTVADVWKSYVLVYQNISAAFNDIRCWQTNPKMLCPFDEQR